jgi:hypothetical protein
MFKIVDGHVTFCPTYNLIHIGIQILIQIHGQYGLSHMWDKF